MRVRTAFLGIAQLPPRCIVESDPKDWTLQRMPCTRMSLPDGDPRGGKNVVLLLFLLDT